MLSGLTEATDILYRHNREKNKKIIMRREEIKRLGKNTIKLNIIQI